MTVPVYPTTGRRGAVEVHDDLFVTREVLDGGDFVELVVAAHKPARPS